MGCASCPGDRTPGIPSVFPGLPDKKNQKNTRVYWCICQKKTQTNSICPPKPGRQDFSGPFQGLSAPSKFVWNGKAAARRRRRLDPKTAFPCKNVRAESQQRILGGPDRGGGARNFLQPQKPSLHGTRISASIHLRGSLIKLVSSSAGGIGLR